MDEYTVKVDGVEHYVTYMRGEVIFYIDCFGQESHIARNPANLTKLTKSHYYVIAIPGPGTVANPYFMESDSPRFETRIMASKYIENSKNTNFKIILKVPVLCKNIEILTPFYNNDAS